jgi:small subunit ribosomal protein S8
LDIGLPRESILKKTILTMTDPIADFLTRIRNASMVGHKVVEIPSSKMKVELTRVLHEKGYILSYKVVEGTPFNTIKIALKYHPESKKAAIKKIIRVSKPGLRQYAGVAEMPRVLNGLGIAILSTNKGILTDKEARTLNVGGEVLCYVY